MKTKLRRIMSLVLSLVLVISLMPARQALSASEVTISYLYDFRGSSNREVAAEKVDATVEDGDGNPTYKYGAYNPESTQTRDRWRFYAVDDGVANDGSRAGNKNGYFDSKGLQLKGLNSGWVALEIIVPEPGTYSVGYTLYHGYYKSYSGLFIYPANTTTEYIESESTTDNANLYAYTYHYDTYEESGNQQQHIGHVSDKKLVATEKNQKFVLVWKLMTSNRTVILKDLTLSKTVISYDLDRVELSLSADELGVKETAQATAAAYLEDGSPLDLSKAEEVKFESSDTAVATVDAATGVVKGVSAGDCEIKVSVKYGTVTKEDSLPLSVKVMPPSVGSTTKYLYNFQANTEIYGEKVTSGGVKIKDADASVEDPENPENNSIALKTNPSYLNYGETISRFWKLYATSETVDSVLLDRLTNNSDKPDLHNYAGFAPNGLVVRHNNSNSQKMWVAFKFKVPEAGKYAVGYRKYGKTGYSTSGVVSIYPGAADATLITPENNASAQYCVDSEIDFNLNDAEEDVETDFVIEAQSAGDEFVFVVQNTGKGSLFIRNFTLTKVADENDTHLELILEEEEIEEDKFTSASVAAYDGIGNPIDLSGKEVSYVSFDKNVADVGNSGLVTATGVGETVITASVTIGATTLTSTKAIKVKDRPAQESLPEKITAGFKTPFLHVGDTEKLIVSDGNGTRLGSGVEYTYEIVDEEILSEENGSFTARAIGKTDIKITAELDGENCETVFTAVVVGKNLLERDLHHGEFEAGIYLSDGSDSTKTGSLWKSTVNNSTDYYSYELKKGVISDITGKPTNIPSFTAKGIGNTNRIRFSGSRVEYKKPSDQRGYIVGNENKLYEFTGYVKAENVSVLPTASIRLVHYNGLDGYAASLKSYYSNALSEKTWGKDWTFFNVPPVILNYSYRENYGMHPDVWFSAVSEGTTLSFAHLSAHEVVFDRATLGMADSFTKFEAGVPAVTKLTLYSNTGNVITRGSTDVPLEVVWKSSDEDIATVSESGEITPRCNGICTITADVTVCGVTKTATMQIDISGLPIALGQIEASADKTELRTGDTAQISFSLKNNDGSVFSGEYEVYYESKNASIASVSQTGVITTKRPGKTEIAVWAKSGNIIVGDNIEITVSDDSPIASVELDGATNVECGFDIRLKVTAYSENMLEADISACSVIFALADDESAQIISVSADGTVTGNAEGVAYVTATVAREGEEPVTSEPYKIKVKPQSPKSRVYNFGAFTGYAQSSSLDVYGWDIDEEKTATLVGRVNSTRLYCKVNGMTSKVKSTGNDREADTAFFIRVDYDGWYEIDFQGMTLDDGTPRACFYMDEKYIGEYCFYLEDGTSSVAGAVKDLNTIYLKKGDHSFIIRSMEEVSNPYQYPIKLKLKYVETGAGIDSVPVEAGKTTLAVGESTSVSAKAIMAGGREYNFGLRHGNREDTENYVELTSSDTDILEISGGVARAKKSGDVTVTAKAVIGEATAYGTIDIKVTAEALAEISFPKDTYDVYMGSPAALSMEARLSDGTPVDASDLTVTYTSENMNVVIEENGRLVGISEGSTTVTVSATLGGVTLTKVLNVNVKREGFASVKLLASPQILKSNAGVTWLSAEAYSNLGGLLDVSDAVIEYRSSNEEILSVSQNGKASSGKAGVANVTVYVTIGGVTHNASIDISVRDGKVKPTYYTEKERANALENAQKYDWAKKQAKDAAELGDYYLTVYETIYNFIPAHTLPRSEAFVDREHPFIGCCMYCGVNCQMEYGTLVFPVDMINRPWKIQCPDCKRLFPSNDFESFYKNGLDEHGEFDYTLARENNGILCGRGERVNGEYVVFDWAKDNPYGYGDSKGNLYNELYKELYPEGSLDPMSDRMIAQKQENSAHFPGMDTAGGVGISQGWGNFKVGAESTAEGESSPRIPTNGYFWGVDDGFGYKTGRQWTSGGEDIFRYIGRLNYFGLWNRAEEEIYAALNALRDAYLYTGEKKYGIAGAALLDRIADLYPDFDFETDNVGMANMPKGGDDSSGQGKIHGRIYENFLIQAWARAYDAFFDVYDEPELISFLSGYAEKWNLENKKTNGELLRQNAEERLLRESYRATLGGQVKGNFGMVQNSMAMVAVVLDSEPESQEIIDFLMRDGVTSKETSTGLGMRAAIFEELDRDGYMHESSLGYNTMTTGHFINLADTLASWDKVRKEDNLAENPKLYKTLLQGADMIVTGSRQPAIGDGTASFGGTGLDIDVDGCLLGLAKTGNPLFAQLIYLAKKGDISGVHYDIFTENPETVQTQIKEIIEEHGEFPVNKSTITTGYGLAVLRDGVKYDNVASATKTNTTRDWWMYFGHKGTTHGQADALNLGIDAFGIDIGPDPGYRTTKLGTPARATWIEGTSAHNTVVVDDRKQNLYISTGKPIHFDDSGSIKVMDVDLPEAYAPITDTYRRTIVSIDVDDTVSYALDFFRIVGGDEHVYSFHSMSWESEMDIKGGAELVPQPGGSYAGINVPVAQESMSNGYNCFEQVERAAYPGTGEFSIDFKVSDWHKKLSGNRDIHLKLTQLNDFELSEIARAKGRPTEKGNNPELIDYLLVRRSGKDLDTLFTSVIEPYEDSSKIKKLTRVSATRTDGEKMYSDEPVAAIKVELVNGRTDYVVYAANNEVEYRIDDMFNFKGFVGVYTVASDDSTAVMRTYLHDGETLGETFNNEQSAVTGEVVSFTKTIELENFIDVTYSEDVDPKTLEGKIIVIENDGVENGTYVIESAQPLGNNKLRIGTGDVMFIRSMKNDRVNYEYNIAEGDTYRIPLTHITDSSPEITVSGEYTTSAGSSIRIPLSVTSDREYTLIGTTLPRGMSLNSETGVLTWKPDSSQVGDNHVAVTVDNGVMSDTVHFIVTVYGSTTSKPSDTSDETPSIGTTDTPAGGGGGGGGGGATPEAPETSDKTDNSETDTSNKTDGENTAPDASGETETLRFTDLSGHAWAADSINALADEGIVKGTTATTYSPANNITRADFALLLVRAFKLESDNTENFADVSANDYFAPELAIARNTGIVNGIGGNKYAPRNAITRQDMMVIVYRALTTNPVGEGLRALPSTDEPQYPDFDTVADYARDAVSALIGAGLVNGKSGRIAPKDYTTRAEVAVLIKRILDYTAQ